MKRRINVHKGRITDIEKGGNAVAELKWEELKTNDVRPHWGTLRAKVPGGWLVKHWANTGGGGVGLTFVPDPNHALN
jgi:hypothetical protein